MGRPRIVRKGWTRSLPFSCLLFFLAACSVSPHSEKPCKPRIFVSLPPHGLLVQKIGGGLFEVQTITPASANPHTFEPTPRQAAALSSGSLWFRLGEPFEEKIFSLLRNQNANLAVYDLRDSVPLLPHEEGGCCAHEAKNSLDRHIWLSPKLLQLQARAIARALILHFPEQERLFQANLDACLLELDLLDQEIQNLLAPSLHRSILTSHGAFGYFCKAYGLEQITIEQEDKEPRPRHLQQVMQRALALKTPLAIALPQHNNKGAQIAAERLHIPLATLDPYAADYAETLRTLARAILAAESENPL